VQNVAGAVNFYWPDEEAECRKMRRSWFGKEKAAAKTIASGVGIATVQSSSHFWRR
jgi:hypothetical protein